MANWRFFNTNSDRYASQTNVPACILGGERQLSTQRLTSDDSHFSHVHFRNQRRLPMNQSKFLLALGCFILAMTGCGGNNDLGLVTGVVTSDGKPVAGVVLEFVPTGGGRDSVAKTNEQGEFEVMFVRDKPGAVIGEHQISFQIQGLDGPAPSEEDEFNPPTKNVGGDAVSTKGRTISPDKVDVKAGQNEIDFKLVPKK
ncbi:MAG: hypothetical protein ACI814_001906 [Mariniblastus sp.]|jgi:hypothetical protein